VHPQSQLARSQRAVHAVINSTPHTPSPASPDHPPEASQRPQQHAPAAPLQLRLLSVAEQLLEVVELPRPELYTDQFGTLKSAPPFPSPPPPATPASQGPAAAPVTAAAAAAATPAETAASEWQFGVAWAAQALAHILGAASQRSLHSDANPPCVSQTPRDTSQPPHASIPRSSLSLFELRGKQPAFLGHPLGGEQQQKADQQQQEHVDDQQHVVDQQQQQQQQKQGVDHHHHQQQQQHNTGLQIEVIDVSAETSGSSGAGTPMRLARQNRGGSENSGVQEEARQGQPQIQELQQKQQQVKPPQQNEYHHHQQQQDQRDQQQSPYAEVCQGKVQSFGPGKAEI